MTSLLVFLIAHSLSAHAQTAPVLPQGVLQSDREAFQQAALLLNEGKFEDAGKAISDLVPSAKPRVFFDWAAVPDNVKSQYEDAAKQAISDWNQALGGLYVFEESKVAQDSAVQVFFDRDVVHVLPNETTLLCSDVKVEASARGRKAVARIALSAPYTNSIHSAMSVQHLVGQALGEYLGLATNLSTTDLMGTDAHNDRVVTKPSAANAADVKSLAGAWATFGGFAKAHVKAHLPMPAISVEALMVDAGDVWRGDTAKFTFKIKNTGDAPLEISAKPNCGCTVANYDKVIAPGGSGAVNAELKTAQFHGITEKEIQLFSNDPGHPKEELILKANIKSNINILPSETPTITLKSDDVTHAMIDIKIDGDEPIEIQHANSSMPYANPVLSKADNGKDYKLDLGIGTEAPPGRSAFTVLLTTSSKRQPQLTVTVITEKGILAVPPSAFLGIVKPDTSLPVSQMITLTKHDGTFHITNVESDDSKLQAKPVTIKEGQIYQIVLSYTGGWPVGQVQRKVTVTTDDPKQQTIVLIVIANIQGT